MGKGENAGYQHFLLFPQCFQEASFSGLLNIGIVWQRVKCFFCDSPGIFKHSQSITKAYLTEISDKADHATVLGNFNAASSLGFILGPAVGGNIAELPHGFYLVALLTGFIFFLNGCKYISFFLTPLKTTKF